MTADLTTTARDELGLSSLHPTQRAAAESVVDGRDTLVVAPTGFGKSAIYQLAALERPGPTVVVSPLIALQADQVAGLEALGHAAVALNSTMPDGARHDALTAFSAGELEFLFVAPEQLARAELREVLAAARPSLVVIDEAHCVSAWGHDFRPDYLVLGPVIDELGRPPVLALTATAAKPTREDIVARLGMRDPVVVVEGFDRPNIALEVRFAEDDTDKLDHVLSLVSEAPPALVYVARRQTAETLAAELGRAGLRAGAYHAGLPASVRREVQEAFLAGDLDVIVATIAFGMGIDKPDVRLVVHHDVPGSIDAYYQEIGRAGRDDAPARAVLLYRPADLGVQRYFAAGGRLDVDVLTQVARAVKDAGGTVTRPDLDEQVDLGRDRLTAALGRLVHVGAIELDDGGATVRLTTDDVAGAVDAAVEADEAHDQLERTRVEMVRAYAETRDCRRRVLLSLFGDESEAECGNCDCCASGAGESAADDGARPWPVQTAVEHVEWGRGEVIRYDRDVVTVLFQSAGYRTLSVEAVLEGSLLDRADP